MTNKTIMIAALAIAAPGLALAAPAQAAAPASVHQAAYTPTYQVESANQWRDRYRDRDYRRYDRGRYDRHDRYDRYDRVNRDTRVWRGNDGRYYCRKDNGTTGLLIGGAVGGLIGHEVAGRGDRTLGAILGAAGGALLGREIDKGGSRCR
ncbi:glycine zipper 2TM domain-containing protein [Pelagerythrobacter sp.]|uniref:glycine zipper 2TM domain-containing protein n=1 Tax=Pelagerythrobacter sp. TaxID=2800702 RepID=UPI0035B43562